MKLSMGELSGAEPIIGKKVPPEPVGVKEMM
jgi:hypothetical protein